MARGASAPSGRGPWSTCPVCGACEQIAVLAKAGCVCRGCSSRLPLHKAHSTSQGRSVSFDSSSGNEEQLEVPRGARRRDSHGRDETKGGQRGVVSGVAALLQQAPRETEDQGLWDCLQQQVAKLTAGSANPKAELSLAEALRRAGSICKDAGHRHGQQ
eukprot:7642268-Pyramimonas_sp.AAC.1